MIIIYVMFKMAQHHRFLTPEDRREIREMSRILRPTIPDHLNEQEFDVQWAEIPVRIRAGQALMRQGEIDRGMSEIRKALDDWQEMATQFRPDARAEAERHLERVRRKFERPQYPSTRDFWLEYYGHIKPRKNNKSTRSGKGLKKTKKTKSKSKSKYARK